MLLWNIFKYSHVNLNEAPIHFNLCIPCTHITPNCDKFCLKNSIFICRFIYKQWFVVGNESCPSECQIDAKKCELNCICATIVKSRQCGIQLNSNRDMKCRLKSGWIFFSHNCLCNIKWCANSSEHRSRSSMKHRSWIWLFIF